MVVYSFKPIQPAGLRKLKATEATAMRLGGYIVQTVSNETWRVYSMYPTVSSETWRVKEYVPNFPVRLGGYIVCPKLFPMRLGRYIVCPELFQMRLGWYTCPKLFPLMSTKKTDDIISRDNRIICSHSRHLAFLDISKNAENPPYWFKSLSKPIRMV